ncbi:hypothetical protein Anapl_11994 [Anas platyrhynchos]|uniref:Uncharacterized protein n=1 Tax=Anas platyrhynchos TaxID=8839 RepID=R0LN89_ANAPL|nr:hypothetical protein Anapl_11994 [Anas platyrhynchos]
MLSGKAAELLRVVVHVDWGQRRRLSKVHVLQETALVVEKGERITGSSSMSLCIKSSCSRSKEVAPACCRSGVLFSHGAPVLPPLPPPGRGMRPPPAHDCSQ